MTKRQEPPVRAESSYRAGLSPRAVARAALGMLAEKGADGVSVRGTAERLGVRMNTVLWHAKTKTRLLELMADAIVDEVSLEGLPAEWRERVRELMLRFRRVLLAHRDGARIVTGTYAAEPATLRFAETLTTALLDGGLPGREAAWTAWNLQYFVLGLTQEEQSVPDEGDPRLAEALAAGDYPSLSRLSAHLRDTSFDGRFDHGLELLLGPGRR
ncbi:TetR/AcrR family transcriptional regulator C-terminal domain-containing protein [Streptomyces spectabilis]|uniref:TetR/AcrR family tetracycline transcriptional repressor n=2 Tax=Streptomyces spectabilis TaxID=68270 RepID=A0A7W8ES50_STRST|nr:TetR/AcrR family transcriptional regulator C-terminal domain-containing protein [Streptomyces spectabilis]MBB5102071.1 TetR/AcrR family tetracycline transcriptional repressor [Streptomyces spectabilis]MCI3907121.1 TetR/AcrR family transcriptional regulator C-terminal domain-containing protein [Streptomyces spectabilis]GGV56061.1 TetR family transcriptional regulator [Streptomyces spectabilis]